MTLLFSFWQKQLEITDAHQSGDLEGYLNLYIWDKVELSRYGGTQLGPYSGK